MRNSGNIIIVIFFAISLIVFASCDESTSSNNQYDFPEPVDSVATEISLYIYSDGWGTLLDSMDLDTEGEVTIDIDEDDPYYDPPQYYIYTKSNGFYTRLYKCNKGEKINVDLEAVPINNNGLTGVIFTRQVYFADNCLADSTLNVTGPNEISFTTKTDSLGRYGFGNLPEGTYTISFSYQDMPFSFELEISSDTVIYEELFIDEPMQERAPYLYLYPEKDMDITVKLDFSSGGYVYNSVPQYSNGWNVYVTPAGIINGQYRYLFYEALLSVRLDHNCGWLLDGSDLENEFRAVLTGLGFIGKEIEDFIEYWIPKLEGSNWYAVYPQDVDSIVGLDISPPPDSILRVLFLVRPLERQISIPEPPVKGKFKRDRFTIVEWGLIGWSD